MGAPEKPREVGIWVVVKSTLYTVWNSSGGYTVYSEHLFNIVLSTDSSMDEPDGGDSAREGEASADSAAPPEAASVDNASAEPTGDVSRQAPGEADDAAGAPSHCEVTDTTEHAMPVQSVQAGVPTLFGLCLRTLARRLKYFYNMHLYPPSLPSLPKSFEVAIDSFDISRLHLLDAQRCFNRVAAAKRAQAKASRTRTTETGVKYQQDVTPAFALSSSLNDKMLRSLKHLLGLEPPAALRLREPPKNSLNARAMRRREKKWISDIENRKPEATTDADGPSGETPKTQKRAVSELKLHREAVTNIGCGLIAEMLLSGSALVELSLQNCQITCAGLIVLATAIKDTKSLRRLDLSNNDSKAFRGATFDNDIRQTGVCALSSALEGNKSVAHLSISCNYVGVDGARALAKMLRKNDTLRRLDLNKTEVGCGAASLIQAFERSKSLQYLNLLWCALRPGLGTQLAALQAIKAAPVM